MGLITKERFISLANKMVKPEFNKVDQLIEYITSTTEIIEITYSSIGESINWINCHICGVEDSYRIECIESDITITYFTRRRREERKPRLIWYHSNQKEPKGLVDPMATNPITMDDDLDPSLLQTKWVFPSKNTHNSSFDQREWSIIIERSECYYNKSCDYKAIAKSRHIADIFGVDIRWCIYKDRE